MCLHAIYEIIKNFAEHKQPQSCWRSQEELSNSTFHLRIFFNISVTAFRLPLLIKVSLETGFLPAIKKEQGFCCLFIVFYFIEMKFNSVAQAALELTM